MAAEEGEGVTAGKILDRLVRVRRVKPNSWAAACPCCESRKGRPLAITETQDGRVLIHAFCGCPTENVLGRIGLTVTDLFDAPLPHAPPTTQRVSARELLTILGQEVTFVALLAADFLERKTISEADWQRLAKAAGRINTARDHVG